MMSQAAQPHPRADVGFAVKWLQSLYGGGILPGFIASSADPQIFNDKFKAYQEEGTAFDPAQGKWSHVGGRD